MIENVPAPHPGATPNTDTCPYPRNNNNNNVGIYNTCNIVDDVHMTGGPTRTPTWRDKFLFGGTGMRGKGDPKEKARRKEEKRQREEEKKARKREKLAKKKGASGDRAVITGQTGESTRDQCGNVTIDVLQLHILYVMIS